MQLVKKIRTIFEKDLAIEDAYTIQLERVHRIGSKTMKPRQVIVKFSHYKDRQRIWLKKTDLRHRTVRIFEDFPAEIRANRQSLWPIYQAARSFDEFKSVSLNQDKLFLNGKLYTMKNIHEIPKCLQPENRCERSSNDAMVFYSKHSVFSNFHAMPVTVEGKTYVCNEQYFQQAKALMFNDINTATKIMEQTDPLKMSQLGKTVKGFDKTVWAKQAPQVLYRVNSAKYEQNEVAQQALLNTGKKKIGEGSPHPTFGTGVHIFSKTALDQTTWSGENVMGQILEKIRHNLTLNA
jgi:ribA/ribD-fused uncharacterized protein